MSTVKILERGAVMCAMIAFGTTLGDNDIGNTKQITLEPGTIIASGALDITTLFDGTSPTLTVTDGTTVYFNAKDASATSYTAITTGLGKFYPNGGTISITNGGTGSTVGQAFFYAIYVKGTGKINEIVTN